MFAVGNQADGVAKLLIEAKADLGATNKVRLVVVHIYVYAWRLVGGQAGRRTVSIIAACMHACVHVLRCSSRSLPWHADLTRHLHHHRDCRRNWVRRMDGRR